VEGAELREIESGLQVGSPLELGVHLRSVGGTIPFYGYHTPCLYFLQYPSKITYNNVL